MYKGIPCGFYREKKQSWGQNFKKWSTLGELISKLTEYFYFGVFLEQSLVPKVIGKKYEMRRTTSETPEIPHVVFSSRIFPRSCIDLPVSGELP